jgi:hypothetical protein
VLTSPQENPPFLPPFQRRHKDVEREGFFPHFRSSVTSTFVSEEEMMVLEMVFEIEAD